jgi:hypothetical protein
MLGGLIISAMFCGGLPLLVYLHVSRYQWPGMPAALALVALGIAAGYAIGWYMGDDTQGLVSNEVLEEHYSGPYPRAQDRAALAEFGCLLAIVQFFVGSLYLSVRYFVRRGAQK